MKKLKKLKLVNHPWFNSKKQEEETVSTNTTVISIQDQRKLQYYESNSFMKNFRRQSEEERRRAAMLIFSFYTRQLMKGEIPDYIVEEHYNLLEEKNKTHLIELLNDGLKKELDQKHILIQ